MCFRRLRRQEIQNALNAKQQVNDDTVDALMEFLFEKFKVRELVFMLVWEYKEHEQSCILWLHFLFCYNLFACAGVSS